MSERENFYIINKVKYEPKPILMLKVITDVNIDPLVAFGDDFGTLTSIMSVPNKRDVPYFYGTCDVIVD